MDSTGEGQIFPGYPASHVIFLECCIKEVNKGNKIGSDFNKIGWKSLLTNFNARTGRNYNKVQLKNHWDAVKKDWKLWDRLVGTKPEIGWDAIQKTIKATPQWWEDKIRVDPELAKFKDRSLEMYKRYYEPIFRYNIVVGHKSMAPSELQHIIGGSENLGKIAGEIYEEDMGENDDILAGEGIADNEGGDGVHLQGESEGIGFSRISLKRDGSQRPSTYRGTTSSSEQSMLECMGMLAALPGVEVGSQFWNEACVLFWKEEARLGFMCQPTPEVKLSYLKYIFENTNVVRENIAHVTHSIISSLKVV